jgi:two-component system catabolic regulation response regulator CreB
MPGPLQVLIVEDEVAIADTIVYALRTDGFVPVWRATAAEALAFAEGNPLAFVILDVGLPDMSGLEVCRALRRRSEVPILFLTSRTAEIDRVVGLELGADDYVAKPFSPRELTARVRAILRRTAPASAGTAQPAPASGTPASAVWEHDAARCRIVYRGQPLELTRNEYRLLCVLLDSPGRVFSRDQLMALAWPDPGAATDRTVDAHVKLLRAKLREVAESSDPIVTHRGLGYSLREE